MKCLHLSVMPAKAGIHWLQVLRDPCRRLPLQAVGRGRDDGEETFFDTLLWAEGQNLSPRRRGMRGSFCVTETLGK
jgi:hypothetical protein